MHERSDPRTLTEATSGSDREAAFWLDQLKDAGKCEEKWRQEAEKLVAKYRVEREGGTRLNIFWGNVQLLKPRVYGQPPAPDVRRRNISEDPFTRETGGRVATLLERALAHSIDTTPFDAVMKAVRDDMLITGRGVSRLAYEVEIVRRTDIQVIRQEPTPGELPAGMVVPTEIYLLDGLPVMPDFDKDGKPFVDQKASETVEPRYVFWADFRMSPARRWEDVWWVGFRHPMDKEQLEREFKDAAKGVPFPISPGKDTAEGDDSRQPADPEHPFGRAAVWEVWNKRQRTVVWVAEGHDKVLRKVKDPLRVEGFFPMPCPLYAVTTTDKMVPVPEYRLYADQAEELNELQDRIRNLTRVLKAVMFVDGDAVEVLSVRDAKDGTSIPVGSPGRTAEDISKSIEWWRINEIIQVITGLTLRAQEVKNQIYEVTGLSDLTRGATKERETAAAQRLKAGFGDVRMTPRSEPMALYVRDMLRLSAEIMAEMYDPETLAAIGGEPVDEAMLDLLRSEKLRNTQIEVQSDSTIRPDRFQQKQEAIEFLTAVAQYLGAAAPIAQQAPVLTPLLLAMLKEAARTFKFGRQVEEQLDQLAAAPTMAPAAPALPAAPAPGMGNGALPPEMLQ